MEYLNDFLDWMESLPPILAYTAILIIAFGENVAPPIPGDMAVVFGGYLVGVGQLNFFVVVIVATIGGAVGFMVVYAVGYYVGAGVLDPDRWRWIPKKQVVRAGTWLDRYGYGLVAANRFLSGLRSVISLSVGIAHTDPWKTALYATLSAAAWTCLIAYAGYAVGDNWPVVAAHLRDYGRIVVGILVAAGTIQVVRWFLKRKGSDRDRGEGGNFNSAKG